MYKHKKIGVIVPAYNEEQYIAQVIETMPSFVDRICVVNDDSTDRTFAIVQSFIVPDGKITMVNREKRGGVGAAIISGHKYIVNDNIDVVAVMAGDRQMAPEMLNKILDPVVSCEADYSKGDRLSIKQYKNGMSAWRAFGSFLLTYLTRIASGYWKLSDPQNGYTAISVKALQKLDLDNIEKGFAFENDMLIKLHCIGARVVDVPHPALYIKNRKSNIRYPQFMAKTSWVLLKGFVYRIRIELIGRDLRGARCD